MNYELISFALLRIIEIGDVPESMNKWISHYSLVNANADDEKTKGTLVKE